jgi:hypothetical protein
MLGQAADGLVEMWGLCWHAWARCRAYAAWANCGRVGVNVGPLLACLGKQRLGWYKCRAYVGLLGQDEVGLVEL